MLPFKPIKGDKITNKKRTSFYSKVILHNKNYIHIYVVPYFKTVNTHLLPLVLASYSSSSLYTKKKSPLSARKQNPESSRPTPSTWTPSSAPIRTPPPSRPPPPPRPPPTPRTTPNLRTLKENDTKLLYKIRKIYEDNLPACLLKHKSINFKTRYRKNKACLLYTSPSPRDRQKSRMPSSA